MRSVYCSIIFLTILSALSGCEVPSAHTQSNPLHLEPSPSVTPSVEKRELAENFYVKSDSLTYAGFELTKLQKSVKLEQTRGLTKVSYAVLQRSGRKVAIFDGVYSGFGNATDFGLFSFLGGDTQQFIISQTIPSGGRHWIVSVSPAYRVLFDSRDFGVGREEVDSLDIDGDGVREISLALTAFYGFENLSPADTPVPEIIFRYDRRERRYLPANHIFPEYALRGIEQETADLSHLEGEAHFSRVLDITLHYIFAGKEREAWALFDRECRMNNRNELKTKILSVLRRQPVYKFVYK
jgi:hypothetical protein